jgi:hypothetical protein
MSMSAILHSAWEARDKAIKDSLAAGKSQAEAEAAGRCAEAESHKVAFSCGVRPLVWAAAGASAGSAIPGIGTAVGALLGYVGGTISAMVSPDASADMVSAAKELLK